MMTNDSDSLTVCSCWAQVAPANACNSCELRVEAIPHHDVHHPFVVDCVRGGAHLERVARDKASAYDDDVGAPHPGGQRGGIGGQQGPCSTHVHASTFKLRLFVMSGAGST